MQERTAAQSATDERALSPVTERSGTGTLAAFTATTFLSAILLFSVQPMFAKMVLPVLGGAPSVWAVAMCFFQAALLAGYCYAHLLIRWLPVRATGLVHVGVSLLAFAVLPIALPAHWGEPPPGEPYLWQLGLFAAGVGLPFFAVAANAPLTQAWFAATGNAHGRDPYFLYAASNLGSLIALLAYPLVFEPAFGVTALSKFWTVGFAVLVAALTGLVLLVDRARGGRAASGTSEHAEPQRDAGEDVMRPHWRQRLGWVGLALVPSALLTAFTTHITTDVASAPLLWVLPLALYLLTFVLVFREQSLIPLRLLLIIHLASVVAALLVMSQTKNESWFVTAPLGTLVFFASAMVAHRTLYERRPAARFLTEFYLWMSLGGALGGLAAALVAPKIFSEVFEYPLLLAVSMACRPRALAVPAERKIDHWLSLWLLLAAGVLAIYWVPWLVAKLPVPYGEWATMSVAPKAWLWFMWPVSKLRDLWAMVQPYGATTIVVALFAAVLLLNWRHPMRQLMAALLMFAAVTRLPSGVARGDAERSYFGVYRVMLSLDGAYNILIHGTTLHGAQRVRDDRGNVVADATPATYYHPASPMAETTKKRRDILASQSRKGRYGVIGLGTGSLACHAAEGEAWRFFEIDPVVVGIAKDSGSFTFIESCQPNPDIVIGDARLTMAKEKDESFDLIIVDAFSSDAVPVHLMTAEALRLYLAKLKPDGIALLHISNRYLDLDAVLAATQPLVAGSHGVVLSDDASDGSYAQSTSTVALFAKSKEALEPYRSIATAIELDAGDVRPWTDDTSDILRPFLSKYRKRF